MTDDPLTWSFVDPRKLCLYYFVEDFQTFRNWSIGQDQKGEQQYEMQERRGTLRDREIGLCVAVVIKLLPPSEPGLEDAPDHRWIGGDRGSDPF